MANVLIQDEAVGQMEGRKAELEEEARSIRDSHTDEHGNSRGYTDEQLARLREIQDEKRRLSESIVVRINADNERAAEDAREAAAALRSRPPSEVLEGDDARRAARWRAYEESDRGREFRDFLLERSQGNTFAIPGLMRPGDNRTRVIASVPTGQTVGTTTGADDWVAEIWSSVFEEARRRFNGLETAGATMFTTPTGGEFHWPTVDDTAQEAVEIQENANITAGTDPTFGEVTFNALRAHTGLISVTRETLQDTIWSVEAYLMAAFGERMGRMLAKRGHNGSGDRASSTQVPQGRGLRLDAINLNIERGSSATPAGQLDMGGSGSELADSGDLFDKLVDLRQTVEPYYLPVSAFVVARDFETVLLKMKDSQDRPLYIRGESYPGISEAAPGRILGYPVYVLDSMVGSGTVTPNAWVDGDTIAYFGDISKFVYRMVAGLDVIRDPFSAKGMGQVQFLGQFRYDCRMVRAGAVGTTYARSPIAQMRLS